MMFPKTSRWSFYDFNSSRNTGMIQVLWPEALARYLAVNKRHSCPNRGVMNNNTQYNITFNQNNSTDFRFYLILAAYHIGALLT